MKSHILFLAVALLLVASCKPTNDDIQNPNIQVNSTSAPTVKITSVKDSISWGYGQSLALALKGDFFDTSLNHELVLQAFAYTLKGGNENLIPNELAMDAYQYINGLYSMILRQRTSEIAQSVDEQQQAYFDNLVKTNPNVKSRKVGDMVFYYEVIKPGKGPKAKFAQRIEFDYRSSNMLTGQPIDQTYGNREPIIHVVGSPMFPGLIEAFQLMNAGSIYKFYFPYQLAFGAKGTADVIAPYTPVIYEIELHELYEN